MQVEIITIGNEVLSGRTLDTNFAFLARALEEASVQVGWHSTVGDTAERISEALKRALVRADAVVVTGGLGPTPDDITRKAVAGVLGRPLQLDDAVLTRIRERGRKSGRKLLSSVETQALLPRGATAWPNPLGTAPGLLMVEDQRPVILLPGVPQEMEALATEFVVPYLRERTGHAVESFTLRTAGVYESQLHERIGNAPQGWPGATLAYLPSYFGVDLRVTVTGSDGKAVRESTRRAYAELKKMVGSVVYAEGTRVIEEVVGEALVARGWRIATAESCTGGLLARRITDVPGSSRYFERGFVTYSNESKIELVGVKSDDIEAHGAVSAPVAEQLAEGARQRAQVEMGVGITGIAGPDGGSEEKPVGLVFIGLASPGGKSVRKFRFMGTRKTVRERAAQAALDLVRRELAGLPLDPGLEPGSPPVPRTGRKVSPRASLKS
jgi:nicotinamide-nucleotide amidase